MTWLPVLSGNYIWHLWETLWAGPQPRFWCCCLLPASPGADVACTWGVPLAQCCIWSPGQGAEEWLQLRPSPCQSLPLTAKWSTRISYTGGSPFPNMPIVWSDPSHNWVATENRRINVSALHLSLTFASTPFEYHSAWKHSKVKLPYLCQSLETVTCLA